MSRFGSRERIRKKEIVVYLLIVKHMAYIYTTPQNTSPLSLCVDKLNYVFEARAVEPYTCLVLAVRCGGWTLKDHRTEYKWKAADI